jgi:hypothetical protein
LKKRTLSKRESSGNRVPEVSHLDEKITGLAASTSRFLQKHWKLLVAIVVVGALGIGGVQILGLLAESREESHHQRLFELTGSPGLFKERLTPEVMDGLERLARDVQGSRAERIVLKQGVEFLLARAEGSASKENDNPFAITLGGLEKEKPPADLRARALALAESLAREGKERFQESPDIQEWALNVQTKIEGERKDWPPAKRAYGVLMPQEEVEATPESTAVEPAGDGDSEEVGGEAAPGGEQKGE